MLGGLQADTALSNASRVTHHPARTSPMPQFDRRAIREVQARYARALDRGDAVLLASTFWPGATVDLPTYQGDFEGLAAALDTPRFRGVRHVVSNELFTFDTGRCHAELYLQDRERCDVSTCGLILTLFCLIAD